ncbi:MAG: sigma 54-interacting transcriptional regulator [bacterium]
MRRAATLAEAELFGHKAGAFCRRPGRPPRRSGEADGGTLLIDEVGELDLRTRGTLLRVLQDGEIRPVGADRPVRVDVRLIAATHRDLRAEVAAGRFREDLFYRLDVVGVPAPLRERPEDVAPASSSTSPAASVASSACPAPASLPRLLRLGRPWPGNVRALEHTLESMIALRRRPPSTATRRRPYRRRPLDLRARVGAFEKRLIGEAPTLAAAATRRDRLSSASAASPSSTSLVLRAEVKTRTMCEEIAGLSLRRSPSTARQRLAAGCSSLALWSASPGPEMCTPVVRRRWGAGRVGAGHRDRRGATMHPVRRQEVHPRPQLRSGAAGVFKANVVGPWIVRTRPAPARLLAVAERCRPGPSSWRRLDGTPAEQPSGRGVVAVCGRNGPTRRAVTCGGRGGRRATLCRCGALEEQAVLRWVHVTGGLPGDREFPPPESLPAWDEGRACWSSSHRADGR